MSPSVNFGGTIHLTGAPQTGFLSCAWVRGGTATKRTETTRNSRQYRFTEFVIENSSCSASCCLIFLNPIICQHSPARPLGAAAGGVPAGLAKRETRHVARSDTNTPRKK